MAMKEKPNFNKLVPILFVKDLESEISFYQTLGFEITYQGDEFQGFVGLKHGDIEFGLEKKHDLIHILEELGVSSTKITTVLRESQALCSLADYIE